MAKYKIVEHVTHECVYLIEANSPEEAERIVRDGQHEDVMKYVQRHVGSLIVKIKKVKYNYQEFYSKFTTRGYF